MANTQPKFKLTDVEMALRRSAGVVSAAAQILEKAYGSCEARTLRNYLKRYPRLREVREEMRQQIVDLAESKLFAKVGDGDITAIIFTLKTQGKDRGYVQRIEATGIDGSPVEVKVKGRVTMEPSEAYRQMLDGSPPARRGRPRKT